MDDIAAYFNSEYQWPSPHDVPRIPPVSGSTLHGRVEVEWFVTGDAGFYPDILGSSIFSRSGMTQNISNATYKINVKEAGEYSVIASYATKNDCSTEIRSGSENGTLITNFQLPNTGSQLNFRMATSNKFMLAAGTQTIAVKYIGGWLYPDYLDFVDKSGIPTTRIKSQKLKMKTRRSSNRSVYSITGAELKFNRSQIMAQGVYLKSISKDDIK